MKAFKQLLGGCCFAVVAGLPLTAQSTDTSCPVTVDFNPQASTYAEWDWECDYYIDYEYIPEFPNEWRPYWYYGPDWYWGESWSGYVPYDYWQPYVASSCFYVLTGIYDIMTAQIYNAPPAVTYDLDIHYNDSSVYHGGLGGWASPGGTLYFDDIQGYLDGPTAVSATGANKTSGDIRKEYVDRGVDFVPECSDFTTAMTSTYFGTNEYNKNGYHPYFIARSTLTAGADGTRSTYGSALTVTNSYRCPDKQYDIDTANGQSFHPGGRHMHGDAIDWSSGNNDTIWQSVHDAAKANGACVEPKSLSTNNHVHADWRGSCPNGQW